MKKTLTMMLLAALAVCALNAQEGEKKLPVFNGLTHAWNFSEDKDGKIVDTVGTAEKPGIDLTISGEPAIVDGVFGKAAKLEGTGDSFSFPKELTFELGDRYTIVMIVRFDKNQSAPLFTTGKDHVRYYSIIPFDGENGNKISAFASVGGHAKQSGEEKEVDLKIGEWNSIVISATRHSGHMKINMYVNGVKIMDLAYVRSPGSLGGDIRYGVFGGTAGRNAKSLAATFDEIQIYNAPLGDREVKQIHDSLAAAK